MNGQGFELEARETKRIETKHRRIVTPIPVPESFELIREMQTYEPISNAGQPLIVWDHTEDGYKVCDPYGNKFIDFSSGVMITNVGHGIHIDFAIDSQYRKQEDNGTADCRKPESNFQYFFYILTITGPHKNYGSQYLISSRMKIRITTKQSHNKEANPLPYAMLRGNHTKSE